MLRLAAFAGFGIGVSALYATTGFGFPCPFRAVTGWDCPLCGGTRLGNALLHGDVAGAIGYNPVVFVGLLALTVLGGAWSMEALGGPALRLPLVWRRWLRRWQPTHWLLVGLTAAVAFTLIRNSV